MKSIATVANCLFGAYACVMGSGHLIGVTMCFMRRDHFVYDFRAYSLLLLGAAIALPGLTAALATPGLWRGDRTAIGLAAAMSLVLLAVSGGVLPLMGTVIPFMAAANLGLVWLAFRGQPPGRLRET